MYLKIEVYSEPHVPPEIGLPSIVLAELYDATATTLGIGGILITHNVGEFSSVTGLDIEDWTEPAGPPRINIEGG